MFNNLGHLSNAQSLYSQIDTDAHLRSEAAQMFERTLRRGHGLLNRLMRNGKTGVMRSLADMQRQSAEQHYLGLQTVDVKRIVGTENRNSEFDGAFIPQADHLQSRWINVAIAYLKGLSLPPVELIQVGEDYYVRDGHHRISVARAMDQAMINAVVTVWK